MPPSSISDEWSRPIFNLTSNFKMLSKQEREERDYEQLPKKRRVRSVLLELGENKSTFYLLYNVICTYMFLLVYSKSNERQS